MKKNFFVALSAMLLSVGVYFGINATNFHDETCSLQLANIDALSHIEVGNVCSFKKVSINEEKHSLDCSGDGRQCCYMN